MPITSDDRSGLKKALQAVFAENARSYAPTLNEREEVGSLIRSIYNAPSKEEARERLQKAIAD